jgi:hypothetical protein
MIDAGGFVANPARSMTTKIRNRFIALCILAFPFLVLSGFIISESMALLPPIQPLPNPNGYDDLVKAGEMVSTNSWNYDSSNLEQLRETTAANAEALALARAGLSNECLVPVPFSQADIENHTSDLADLKRLAQALAAEGKLAEMENRPDDAAKSYLDTIHLANESARGGVLIDELVGMAIEAIGTSHLQKIADHPDAKSCRETATALEALDSQKQTWNEVMQQEHTWSRRAFTGIRYEIIRLMGDKPLKKAFQKAGQKFQEQQMKTRRLIIDLAAHAYELDKGKPPASVADLVPDYLKTIPQNPFTGTNMVYSPR